MLASALSLPKLTSSAHQVLSSPGPLSHGERVTPHWLLGGRARRAVSLEEQVRAGLLPPPSRAWWDGDGGLEFAGSMSRVWVAGSMSRVWSFRIHLHPQVMNRESRARSSGSIKHGVNDAGRRKDGQGLQGEWKGSMSCERGAGGDGSSWFGQDRRKVLPDWRAVPLGTAMGKQRTSPPRAVTPSQGCHPLPGAPTVPRSLHELSVATLAGAWPLARSGLSQSCSCPWEGPGALGSSSPSPAGIQLRRAALPGSWAENALLGGDSGATSPEMLQVSPPGSRRCQRHQGLRGWCCPGPPCPGCSSGAGPARLGAVLALQKCPLPGSPGSIFNLEAT